MEGGRPMAKQEVQLTFNFVNPNTPKEFEKQFRKILIEKLLALYGKTTAPAVIFPRDRHFPPRLRREPENMAKLYHSLALYGII